MIVKGNLVDVHKREVYPARLDIADSTIQGIDRIEGDFDHFIIPGFVDAHIHIESSMLIPYEFSKLAVRHGTVATVSDPHEIANVMGVPGVDFMIRDAERNAFKFFFGAPSCVPATAFESAGAIIDDVSILDLLRRPNIRYLAEMMNYPGVLSGDAQVMKKIAHALALNKPIDGHAPGLLGKNAVAYIQAGISTDHECTVYEEALHKANNGMKILIREGSAAKNFDALVPLFHQCPEQLMFCSDDKHPDDLIKGHINELVVKAIQLGYDPIEVLRAASINPINHYQLPVGQLREGDPADFALVKDLSTFEILETYIDGSKYYNRGELIATGKPRRDENINNFKAQKIVHSDLIDSFDDEIPVIKAIDGSLLTDRLAVGRKQIQDESNDMLKIAVVNRYTPAKPSVGYINGFGIQQGAIASTVAHDSHNIIAVGKTDEDIVRAVNGIIDAKGGVICVCKDVEKILPLPIAGLMSDQPGEVVAKAYEDIDRMAKEDCGSILKAPFMTLSFMALLVIPSLKISDQGLFDVDAFGFV